MSTLDATENANDTISGGSITHVGQAFFDQELITLVETKEPYTRNTQKFKLNADDWYLAEEAATINPLIEYVLLGDDVSEGVFGWMSFGMDINNAFNITPAAFLRENGGEPNLAAAAAWIIGSAIINPTGGPLTGIVVPTGAPSETATTSTAVDSTLSTAVVLTISSSSTSKCAYKLYKGAPPFRARPYGDNDSQSEDGHFPNTGKGSAKGGATTSLAARAGSLGLRYGHSPRLTLSVTRLDKISISGL